MEPAGRKRGKPRRTQSDQMSSELASEADIAQYSRHVSKVPQSAVSTRNKSLAPIPGSWPRKVTECEYTPAVETGRLHLLKPPKMVNDLTDFPFDH
jgi:hypothetical protein